MINNWFEFTLDELKRGFAHQPQSGRYVCLVCGKAFDEGEVFELHGRFYLPERAAALHVQTEHGGMAAVLLGCEKKAIGLTDNQKELFASLLQGLSDNEIAAGGGVSPATVRHTRFTLRERARQATLYLALYELTDQYTKGKGGAKGRELIEVHEGAKMVDERYAITIDEEEKTLKTCFISLEPLRLKVFSAKEKKKIVILKRIVTLFAENEVYTERQVNAILKPVFEDFATLRRYLIEYGFMERNADGSVYRLTNHHGTV